MNSYYGSIVKFNFQPADNIEKGDIVWITWSHYRHGGESDAATPTQVIKVYDDGNIIHHRRGYDDPELAWAKDIVAKSPGIPFDRVPYRTMKISQIREEMYQNQLDAQKIVDALSVEAD